jgi:hypothetical protein
MGAPPAGASLTSSEWWRTLFDVDVATIDRWKGKHPEFCGALKRGKMAAIARPLTAVARALVM